MSLGHDARKPVTGLPDPAQTPDPFVLLERVMTWDAAGLTAAGRACGSWWAVIEAAAQACCWHQRHLADFAGHSFLLSVDRAPLEGRPMRRGFTLQAMLNGQASMAAVYTVLLTPAPDDAGCRPLTLELAVARMRMDDTARQQELAAYYRKVWSWLISER